MRRGDVYWVGFDPVLESEANKRRPAVIVSNDGANRAALARGRGTVTVVPLSGQISRVYPFQVLLHAVDASLPMDSKAQAEQVRTVSVTRLGERIGHVPPLLLARIDDALRLHLAL